MAKKVNVLFLYGPPASGKLTVAQELAKITDLRVFHNHLAFDLVNSIIPINSIPMDEFFKMVNKAKEGVFPEAIKQGTSFIFTWCYQKGKGHTMARFVRKVRKMGVEPLFVRLACDPTEVMRRAGSDSRKKKGNKLTNKKILANTLKLYDYYGDVPFGKTIVIDNTKTSAKKVAQQIKRHYQL